MDNYIVKVTSQAEEQIHEIAHYTGDTQAHKGCQRHRGQGAVHVCKGHEPA